MINKELILFNEKMIEQGYSEKTVKSYIQYINSFHNYSKIVAPDQNHLFNYCSFLHDKDSSYSYIKNSVMAIRLFSELVFDVKLEHKFLAKFRKTRKLPEVLTLEEVKKLINSIVNIKHNTIISLIYSCGLKVSECINIKVKDIDFRNFEIKIEDPLTKKTRSISLSYKVFCLIRNYIDNYKPKKFLFEGKDREKYSVRSIQTILKIALENTGIKKNITVQSLRHSFAVHLMEQGTDLSLIQIILGHKNFQSTLLYKNYSPKMVQKVHNPFDDI